MRDEEALRILRAILSNGCSAGQEISTETMLELFEEARIEEDYYLSGLAKAAVRGWIVAKEDGVFCLTADGAAAGAKSAH